MAITPPLEITRGILAKTLQSRQIPKGNRLWVRHNNHYNLPSSRREGRNSRSKLTSFPAREESFCALRHRNPVRRNGERESFSTRQAMLMARLAAPVSI